MREIPVRTLINIFLITPVISLILNLGCTAPAVTGIMPPEIDRQIKNLKPPRDKALIYVLRPEMIVREKKIQITCDGQFMGYTKGGMYLAFLVDPGLHVLTAEDSLRIVDDFPAYYHKEQANKFKLLGSGSGKDDQAQLTQAHLSFIKKHNLVMQCFRSQNCNVEKVNRLLKNKPLPLEMYQVMQVQGGKTYYLIQTFRAGWDHPDYILSEPEPQRAQAFLKNLRHSRYVNPRFFPRELIKFSQNMH